MLALLTYPMAQAHAQGEPAQACRDRPRGAVPAVRIEALARGFNLVGWMDRKDRRRPPPDALEQLKSRGFTHVRLPVDGALLMPANATPAEIADRLAELDAALTYLIGLGYVVSLDMHPSAVFNQRHRSAPEAAYEELRALWLVLAARYRQSPPDKLFFELLNEPAPDTTTWRRQRDRLIEALRPALPQHTFIIGTADYQQVHRLLESAPVADPNVVYAVHFYEPMSFTHQGADWAPDDPVSALAGAPFPLLPGDPHVIAEIARLTLQGRTSAAALLARDARAAWTPVRIAQIMSDVAAWSRRSGRAVIVNEFGVLKSKAPPDDRVRWLAAVREAAERACLGWAVWEFDEGFGFVSRTDTGGFSFDEDALNALIPNKNTERR